MDIVERLRSRRQLVNRGNGDVQDIPDEDCEEAANLIESLREGLKPMFTLHIDLDTPKGIAYFRSLDEAEAFADFLANIDKLRRAHALVKPDAEEGKCQSQS